MSWKTDLVTQVMIRARGGLLPVDAHKISKEVLIRIILHWKHVILLKQA